MSTILQLVTADRNLTTLTRGLKSTELEETLGGNGPFTILAPINLAFNKLGPADYEELVKSGNSGKLSDLLSYHVLVEKRLVKDFYDGQKLKTIHGKELGVSIKDGEVRINGARILSKDRQGSNGVVHSVDAVSTPFPEEIPA
ncbi:MAG: fasciclin domain-containing protein [Chitinophagaceae bacterium]